MSSRFKKVSCVRLGEHGVYSAANASEAVRVYEFFTKVFPDIPVVFFTELRPNNI